MFHQNLGPSTASSTGDPIRRDQAAHGLDRDLDALDRPAFHVEQPPLDHLLGPERDVGIGLVGVGVELDPAGAVAWRNATAPVWRCRDDEVRGASSRNRPEPSLRAWPIADGLIFSNRVRRAPAA